MEPVRTAISSWVESHEPSCANDLFRSVSMEVMNELAIDVELSPSLSFVLDSPAKREILQKRRVQCRLIWELQSELERMLMKSHIEGKGWETELTRVATVILFLLSFPGLTLEISEVDELANVLEGKEGNGDCLINLGCYALHCGPCKKSQGLEENGKYSVHVDVKVACGAQDLGVRIVIDVENKCAVKLKNGNQGPFKWKWWRDAFLGRLEGFQEWRRDVGVPAVNFDSIRRKDSGTTIQHFVAVTQAKFRTWGEWPPFRTNFCRFELEIVARTWIRSTQGRVRPICYTHATEDVLRDACLLVKETLQKGWDPCAVEQVDEIQDCEDKSVAENTLRVARGFDDLGALVYYQKAAVEHGSTEGLKKSLDMLRHNGQTVEDFSKAIVLLHNFMGTVFSWRTLHLEVNEGGAEEIDSLILPECERLMMTLKDNEFEVEKLCVLVGTCLVTNAGRHEVKGTSMIQKLIFYCFGGKSQLVSHVFMTKIMTVIENEELDNNCTCPLSAFALQRSAPPVVTENQRTLRSILELVVSKSGPPKLEASSTRGFLPNDSTFSSHSADPDQNHNPENRAFSDALTGLGGLLHNGVLGVGVDSRRAYELFDRAIREEKSLNAMVNMALLLETGGDGLSADVPRAVTLYETAIRDGNRVNAMVDLALLLETGSEDVAADPRRAMELYERAVKAKSAFAMNNLGVLLTRGAEGIPVDIPRAVKLYEDAIDVGNYYEPMKGEGGIAVDTGRTLDFLNMMVDVCGSVDAMWVIAWIHGKGENGVPRNMEMSKTFVRRAIATQQRTEKVGNLVEVSRGFAHRDGHGEMMRPEVQSPAPVFERKRERTQRFEEGLVYKNSNQMYTLSKPIEHTPRVDYLPSSGST
ncbi:Sel1-repeat containing protein [Gracilaria domingensis]|nr:Sel1-repeat containing protein [Gracilaria domingensis]